MKQTVFDTIRALGLERKAEQRRKSTLYRTLSNGRCGVCRKKPYGCKCSNGPTLKPADAPQDGNLPATDSNLPQCEPTAA